MSAKAFVLMLSVGFSLGLVAICPAFAAGPSQVSDKPDSSGRQIASVVGVRHGGTLPKNPAVKPVEKSASCRSEKKTSAGIWAQIERGWPPTVQDAADRGCTTSRNCMRVAAAKLDQFGKWLAHLDQQLNSMPVATPLGRPYVTKHLHLAPDARLRTVIQQ